MTDLGYEWYELPERKYSYRVSAEGHNTLVINPADGIYQQDCIGCFVTDYGSGNEAYAVTDLTPAYEMCDVSSVKRGLKLIKDKKCVIVQDEINLKSSGEIYWFAHTKADIKVSDDGKTAILTLGSEKLQAVITGEGQFTAMEAVPLSSTPEVPGQSDNSAYRKLAIHLADVSEATISVAFTPLKSGETEASWIPSLFSMSEWKKSPYTENAVLKGDINSDAKITASDVVLMKKHLFGTFEITGTENADLNEDGRINIVDLIMLCDLLVKSH